MLNIHSLSSDPLASVYLGGLIGHGLMTITSSHTNGVITAQDGPSTFIR
ncbi:MAG: hypothetical protein K8963_07845 [Proteobacteria bacterium]|nr:hypothetical protein [Pseudomonadota bacterium]